MALNDHQLERYARQVILPEFGEEAQERLLATTVLVVGAGGLGAPVIQYLAAAGIGAISIVDHDTVEATNLNRQVIHDTASIGASKAENARRAALRLNPELKIDAVAERFTAENAAKLTAGVDIIADCTDSPVARYAINLAARQQQRPLVFGGAVRMEGQVTSFRSGIDAASPCFACIFPETPGQEQAPRCSEAGIIGPVTGVIGTMMALEVIRQALLPETPLGAPLTGTLLLYDGRYSDLTRIAVERRKDCPHCGG